MLATGGKARALLLDVADHVLGRDDGSKLPCRSVEVYFQRIKNWHSKVRPQKLVQQRMELLVFNFGLLAVEKGLRVEQVDVTRRRGEGWAELTLKIDEN